MRRLLLLTIAFALLATPAKVALADCKLHVNDRIVLYSVTDDPDVLVWDSRFRLRSYNAATFDQAQQLLPHAYVAKPGTRAIIESCVPDFVVSPELDHPNDAVGIIIISGPDRGKSGWVLSSDIRGVYHPIPH